MSRAGRPGFRRALLWALAEAAGAVSCSVPSAVVGDPPQAGGILRYTCLHRATMGGRRGMLCVFWMGVSTFTEETQKLPVKIATGMHVPPPLTGTRKSGTGGGRGEGARARTTLPGRALGPRAGTACSILYAVHAEATASSRSTSFCSVSKATSWSWFSCAVSVPLIARIRSPGDNWPATDDSGLTLEQIASPSSSLTKLAPSGPGGATTLRVDGGGGELAGVGSGPSAQIEWHKKAKPLSPSGGGGGGAGAIPGSGVGAGDAAALTGAGSGTGGGEGSGTGSGAGTGLGADTAGAL